MEAVTVVDSVYCPILGEFELLVLCSWCVRPLSSWPGRPLARHCR